MGELATNADKLTLGLQTTGLGLLVTFVALVFLIVIITILSAIMKEKKRIRAEIGQTQAPKGPVAAVEQPVAEAVNVSEADADDSELVAVLAAAASAYMRSEQGGGSGLVIRSYRKVNGTSAWANAGRNAQIYNKF